MKKLFGTSALSMLCVLMVGCSNVDNNSIETSPSVSDTVSGSESVNQTEETEESSIVAESTVPVSKAKEYNTNLYSTWGRLYTDDEKAYFVELSSDEKTQIIYSLSDTADSVPEKIYETASYMQDNIGYISCNFMAGYDDTIVFVDSSQDAKDIVYYVTKDGSDSGVIGTIPGDVYYTDHYQDGDKVYYKTNPIRKTEDYEDNNIPDYYEVDIKNRTLSKIDIDIDLEEDSMLYIIAVTQKEIIYAYYKDKGVLCIKDRETGEQTEVANLPDDTMKIFLAGEYVIYITEEGYVTYSMNIRIGESYKICSGCELELDNGVIHVVNDEVYYLDDERDLYCCTIKGENNKLIAKETDSGYKYMLGTFGDWIFFKYNKSSNEYYYRMRKNESEFPDKAIIDVVEDNTGKTEEVAKEGFRNKDELVLSFIKWMNGNLSSDEFYKSFDEDVYLAYILTEEFYSAVPTLDDGYIMLQNEDSQSDTIKEFLKEERATVANMLDLVEEIRPKFSKFGPYEEEINEDYYWDSQNGYSKYKIYVEDEDEYIRAVEFYFTKKDGLYYWAVFNTLA